MAEIKAKKVIFKNRDGEYLLPMTVGSLKIGQIGIAPLGIDETLNLERYLNGQIILQDQFQGFTKFLKRRVELYPSIACLEEEWQTIITMSAFSQCGKFVIDDNAGTIRLPKVVNIQGLTDLSKLAEIVEAGLPNITGGLYDVMSYHPNGGATGVFTGTNNNTKVASTGNYYNFVNVTLDASRSNPTYGNSNTVQQEQIQYPYFIQVATGAETEDNIINEIELNNPYSLGDSKYSPQPLNNLSWLKSEGQWNSKAVYPAYYDWALINANNGVEGFKFITDEYTDYDVVINSAEETFRLPLLDGSEDIPNYNSSVTGSLPFTVIKNGWIQVNLSANNANTDLKINDIFVSGGGGNNACNDQRLVPVSKGDVVNTNNALTKDFTFFESIGNGSLYYYVGETVQNANLINAGRIEETLVKKVDMQQATIASFPSDRYTDLTLGANGTTYIAPANGWVYFGGTTTVANQNIRIKNKITLLSSAYVGIGYSGIGFATNLPVKKGDVFVVEYGGVSDYIFRFIYAEGEI